MTKSALLFFLSLASLLLSGCTPGVYGRLDFQIAVEDMFESGQILENHTYYHIGPDAEPDTIMAIENQYTLFPSLWKKSEVTPALMSIWNLRIENKYRFRNIYKGAVILDENGNRLGIWYSRLHWTMIKRGEGNSVIIYTPDTTKGLERHGRTSIDNW